jgi:UDP-N-acetylglucosamine diphosphorylase / glucose-1-phosphate thymidylyltransferase / UDP-N-acetylgalactosamine diphosphorylase / glucosamine-1-phosphate N-acetyltransferase / galactosamine-1-phosphate N-acetyltransferase
MIKLKELQAEYFFDVSGFKHKDLFKEGAYVWEVLSAIKGYLAECSLGKIETTIPEGVYLENAELISIGKGTVVEAGAYIKGPCVIGEHCQIRHGAYIRGNVIVGNGAVVGHCTEVKNSIFMDKAQAGHFAYIGDSILGNEVNLGAGTKCANLKLDHGNISISFKGQRIQTGRRKFGAIIGDKAQLGCNSVTNPGTLLGKKTLCLPCVNVNGFVASNNIYRVKSLQHSSVG